MSIEHPHPAPHPKQSYNSAGDGWTYLTELNAPNSTPEGEGRPVPEVRLQEKLDHATVIRLSFRNGDLMDDHHAPAPILVLAQSGTIKFTAGGKTMEIKPGTAVHVDAGNVHSLLADEGPAVVILVVLTAQ